MTTNSAFTTLSWKRSLVQPNEREDENVGEEFFNDVDTLDEISSLVRESMQNSIDEALSHGMPVKVRFTVGKQSIGMNRNYFDEILSHAKQSLHPNLLPDLNQNSKLKIQNYEDIDNWRCWLHRLCHRQKIN